MKCNQSLITLILVIIIVLGTLIFITVKERTKLKEKFANEPIPSNQEATIITANQNINTGIANLIQSNKTYLDTLFNPTSIKDNISNSLISSINRYSTALSNDIQTSASNNNTIITTLNKQLADLQKFVDNKKNKDAKQQQYTKIKSLNDGEEFNLLRTPQTYFKSNEYGSNIAAYMVNMNCGCLGVGATDYDIFECNDKDTKQYFNVQTIFNKESYEANIDRTIPNINIDNNIQYPFSMIKSVNNDNCLTNNQGKITVQPCSKLIAQRWITL